MGPVMAVLVFNLVIFVIVVIVVVKSNRKRNQATKDKSVKVTIQTLISIVGIVFLFGLTWLFGAFTVTETSQLPFLILFVVFSSFQGFFVFLFFCVLNKVTRQAWIRLLTRGRNRKTLHHQKAVKPSALNGTLSTTLQRSFQQYSTLDTNRSNSFSATTKDSGGFIPDGYDMQEMQIEIYHTTEEEAYLKEGALETDTSQTVRPTLRFITCSATESHIVSNPGADQDTNVLLTVHPTPPVYGDNTTYSAAKAHVVCAHQDKS